MPSVDLYEDSPANKVNIAELCAGKKVILFAVPGAFTPGCSKVLHNLHVLYCYQNIVDCLSIHIKNDVRIVLRHTTYK